jgi:NhaP-type Na+/H+ or K+/H+ antiporter
MNPEHFITAGRLLLAASVAVAYLPRRTPPAATWLLLAGVVALVSGYELRVTLAGLDALLVLTLTWIACQLYRMAREAHPRRKAL